MRTVMSSVYRPYGSHFAPFHLYNSPRKMLHAQDTHPSASRLTKPHTLGRWLTPRRVTIPGSFLHTSAGVGQIVPLQSNSILRSDCSQKTPKQ